MPVRHIFLLAAAAVTFGSARSVRVGLAAGLGLDPDTFAGDVLVQHQDWQDCCCCCCGGGGGGGGGGGRFGHGIRRSRVTLRIDLLQWPTTSGNLRSGRAALSLIYPGELETEQCVRSAPGDDLEVAITGASGVGLAGSE